jgi:hypothetical protein
MLEATDEAAKLGELASFVPHVGPEEGNDQDEQYVGQCLVAMGEVADSGPGGPGKKDGQCEEHGKGEAPKFLLAFFELLEARGDGSAVCTA